MLFDLQSISNSLTLLTTLSLLLVLTISCLFNPKFIAFLRSMMELITPSDPQTHDQKQSNDMDVLSYLLYRALGSADPVSPKTISASLSAPQSQPKNKGPNLPPKQPFDALLVFDVEATCIEDSNFNWCNEIIEWPVVLLRWKDKSVDGRATELVKVDEFRTYVRPTYRPVLSDFCQALTGIAQRDVNQAPVFHDVLAQLKDWLVKHSLLCPKTERPLQRFMWCTDGPYDIRDFVVKQCFISSITMPRWLYSEVMDVRKSVTNWLVTREEVASSRPNGPQQQLNAFRKAPAHFRRPSLNITSQLQALHLPPFEGRLHCGIDDTRNIARIVSELARLGLRLESNITIDPKRRWYWMGPRPGEIYPEYL